MGALSIWHWLVLGAPGLLLAGPAFILNPYVMGSLVGGLLLAN